MPHHDAEKRSRKKEAKETRKSASKKRVCVLGPRNFFSSLFQIWALKILQITFKPDHGDRIKLSLMREDTSKESSSLLEKQLETMSKGKLSKVYRLFFSSRLERAIYETFKLNLIFMAFWRVMWMLPIMVSSYWLFKILIRYFARMDGAPTTTRAHLTAAGVLLCHLLSIAGYHKYAHIHLKTGVQCRAALIPLVYKKLMQGAVASNSRFEVANLISKDCNIVTESVINSVNFWLTIPECVLISVIVLYEFRYLGIPAVGFIFLICLPLQMLISSKSCVLILKETAAFVERSKVLLEVLTLIRMIKMYAWEDHYKKRLLDLAKKEVPKIRTLIFWKSCELFTMFYAPLICIFATILTASLVNPSLFTPLYVFIAMSVFSVFRYPLAHFPYSYRSMKIAKSSFEILDEYLSMNVHETPLTNIPPPQESPDLMCELINTSFSDTQNNELCLKRLNLKLYRGKITAIVGNIACGKILLLALMGLLKLDSGTAYLHGTVGHVPQVPWVFWDSSVASNVTLNDQPNKELLKDVFTRTCISKDLTAASASPKKTLSRLNFNTRQLHQISIARSLYRKPGLLLIEDIFSPFSADQVQQLLSYGVISGNHTPPAVLLLTQHKRVLSVCDQVIVMKNGEILDSGTPKELEDRGVNFSYWVTNYDVEAFEPPTSTNPGSAQTGRMGFFYNKLSRFVGSADIKRLECISSGNSSLVWESGNGIINKPPKRDSHIVSEGSSPRNTKNHGTDGMQLGQTVPSVDTVHPYSATPEGCPSGTQSSTTESLIQQKARDLSVESDSFLSDSSRKSIFSESVTLDKKKKRIRHNTMSVSVFNFRSAIGGSKQKKSYTISEESNINRKGVIPRNSHDYNSYDGNQMFNNISHKSDALHPPAPHKNGHPENSNFRKIKREKKNIFFFYLRDVLGSTTSLAIVIIITSVKSLRFFTDWIVGYYTFDKNLDIVKTSLNYGLAILLATFLLLAMNILTSLLIASKNRCMRTVSTDSILKAPISFFEKTPINVILESLVSDIFIIDTVAPDMVIQLISHIPEAAGIAIQASVLVVPYIAAVVIYLLCCLVLIKRYMRVHSKIVRMDYTNNVRLVSHITSTIDGVNTIRLCNLYDRFEHFNTFLVDTCHKSFYLHMIVKYIAVLQSDILVSLSIYFAILVSIFISVSYSNIGIAMTNLNTLGLYVGLIIRNIFDINFPLKGLYKFKTLCDNTPSEYPEDSPAAPGEKRPLLIDPGPTWPKEGKITFKNVSIKYSKDSLTVVKNMSFGIFHAEHFGIFAKPGSGKTTISFALLRLLPLEEGQIIIDGVDISTVDIKRVRKSISIIPQDPLLLIGTIRSNLDPSNSVPDGELWNVLNVVHLADRIKEEFLKLDTDVVQHAKSFSHFERQLFFMARAILFKSNIIVFDEPAVFADRRSDALFHKIIRESLSDCTVIVLSARISFLKPLDRLIIIQSNQIVESGSPGELSEDPKSLYSKMLLAEGNSSTY